MNEDNEVSKVEVIYTNQKYIPKEKYHTYPTDKIVRTPITVVDLSKEK